MILPLLLGCLGQGYTAVGQTPETVADTPPPGLPVKEVCHSTSNYAISDVKAYYVLQPGDDSWNTVARRFRPATRDNTPRVPIDPDLLIKANLILYEDLETNPKLFYEKWFKPGNPVYLPAGITCYDYVTSTTPAQPTVVYLKPAG